MNRSFMMSRRERSSTPRRHSWLIAFLCAVALASACRHRYVLPNGDGESTYSPPALQGRITAVAPEQLTIMADGGDSVTVQTTADTKYYKLAGGLVLRPELMMGHRVRVWYQVATPKAGEPLHAAVVVLSSLDPNDDWPK